MIKNKARIKKKEFMMAIRDDLTNVQEFAMRVGTSASWLCRLYSDKGMTVCSPYFAGKICGGFEKKEYTFDDLFFWV